MRLFTLLFFAFSFSITSIAQDDRGCGISHYFTIYNGPNANAASGYAQNSTDLLYYDLEYLLLPDSAITYLESDDYVRLEWDIKDELMYGSSNYSVKWYKNGVLLNDSAYDFNYLIEGGACHQTLKSSSTLVTQETGFYQMVLKHDHAERKMPIVFIREKPAEEEVIEEEPAAVDFAIYPNPSSGIVNIQHGEKTSVTIYVIDVQGAIVRSTPLNATTGVTQFSLEGLAPGSYVVKALDNQTEVYQTKLILR